MLRFPRFIFYIFVGIFCVVSPLILAFSAGYRFNFTTLTIFRIGLIIIDGKPQQTNVYQNNRLVSEKLPVRISNVAPDSYQFRLESKGYHDINLERELRSAESLIISPIFLLKKTVPQILEVGEFQNVIYDSSYNNIFLEKKNNLNYQVLAYDTKEKKLSIWFESYDPIISLIPNSNGTNVLVQTKNSVWFVVSSKESRAISLSLTNPMWSRTDADTLFALDSNQTLIKLITNNNQPSILSKNVDQFLGVTNSQMYFVKTTSGKTDLIAYSLERSIERIISDIPPHNIPLNIIPSPKNMLFFEQNGIVKQLDSTQKNELFSYEQHTIAWKEKDDDILLYWYNPYEIIRYDVERNRIATIARYSDGIRAVLPLIGTDYVLIAHNDELIAQTVNNLEQTQITLLQHATIEWIKSNQDGTAIFIYGEINNVKGLFTLELRDT